MAAEERGDGQGAELLPGQLRCDWCGWPFRPPKATGRKPRYCRRSCRQRAFEARQTRREVEAAVAYRAGARVSPPEPKVPSAQRPASPPLKGAEEPTLW